MICTRAYCKMQTSGYCPACDPRRAYDVGDMATVFRWHVTVTYRTDAGPLHVVYDIRELAELDALVERGPDWNTIEKIEIVLARPSETSTGYTVEEAARR